MWSQIVQICVSICEQFYIWAAYYQNVHVIYTYSNLLNVFWLKNNFSYFQIHSISSINNIVIICD